jgi:S-adenosylmethionine hydrolase
MADRPIITLLTDFGWGDGYIGAMKGVILDINPDCCIIDLAHHIPPHDVMGGALVLGQTYTFFPAGTIHVAVVDPGVGGARRPLILEAGDYLFVGPDNGIFTFVLKQEQGAQAYELVEERFRLPRVSQTFHGRDIFAPAAAHLSREVPPAEMGPVVDSAELTTLAIPEPTLKGDLDGEALLGEVIWVDYFGNLITNISQERLGEFATGGIVELEIKGERIRGLKTSYEEGQEGEVIALWGGAGFLEISLKGEGLHGARGWGRGEPVRIRRGK